jgi:hypothetical protein
MSQDQVPGAYVDTPHGRLHQPLPFGRQVLVLAAAFFGGPIVGWLVGEVPGDLSESARTMLYVPYVATFFLGYAVWVARLNAIAFDAIGRSLFLALFRMIVLRRRPGSAAEVLPSKEKLLEMAVRAQKAGASFVPVSLPIAGLAGLMVMLFDTDMSRVALLVATVTTCVGWGCVLGWLGRHGWLPFMEDG